MSKMKVKIHNEAGYKEAMIGLSFNKDQTPEKMSTVANKLSPLDYGHNKFLESMIIWVEVKAPRYWWQEADTYRLSTKQSQSTMHTITKRQLTSRDFIDEQIPIVLLNYLNQAIDDKNLRLVKQLLPESFLQKRLWCMSYKTFRNIYKQRKSHKLIEWRIFIDEMLKQLNFPQFIKD